MLTLLVMYLLHSYDAGVIYLNIIFLIKIIFTKVKVGLLHIQTDSLHVDMFITLLEKIFKYNPSVSTKFSIFTLEILNIFFLNF